MKAIQLCLVLCACTFALAQDVVKAAPNKAKVLKENAQVRVIVDRIEPGQKEAVHSHPAGWYYVTSPGKLKVNYTDGKSEIWEAKPGEQAWMDAERPHSAENIGSTPVEYVLVEVKGPAKK